MSSDTKRIETRLDMGPCCVCGRPAFAIYGGGAVRLSDGSPVCGDCVRRLRFMYPVSQRAEKKQLKRIDSLAMLDSEGFKAALEASAEKLEDLRESFGGRLCVMRVDSFAAEKQGLFMAPRNAFTGCVLYGKLNIGDRVWLCAAGGAPSGAIAELTICDISAPLLGGSMGEAGYPVTIYAEGRGISAQPGDLIVK